MENNLSVMYVKNCNDFSIMVVHKDLRFGERLYKFVDCGERLTCTSGLKSHYKLHKQQNLNDYANDEFNSD